MESATSTAQKVYTCQICGNERPQFSFDAEGNVTGMDLLDPYAELITCKEHRGYQYYRNLDAAKAIAGFGDGTFDEETTQSMRENIQRSKERHDYILQLVKENISEELKAGQVASYIRGLAPQYDYTERDNIQEHGKLFSRKLKNDWTGYYAKTAEIVSDPSICPLPLGVITSNMGINLVSVEGVSWESKENGQLQKLTIHFIPA